MTSPASLRVIFVQGLVRIGTDLRPSPFVAAQEESLRRAGVDVLSFYVEGRHFWKYPGSVARFRRFVKSADADLVHSHFVYNGAVALCQRRVPTVISFLGGDVFISQLAERGAYVRAASTFLLSQTVAMLSTEVIVKSEPMRVRLWRSRDVHVVPNGVDLSRFRPMSRSDARQRLGLDDGRPYVIFPANAQRPEKDFALAEAAFAIVQRQMPEARLVELDGVAHADVPTYLNAVDALVFTSKSEGSPNVIKEALACNLPIVSVEVGDVAEAIDGTKHCHVVRSRSAEEIAANLLTVLAAHERSDGEVRAATMDSSIVAQRLMRIYRLALNRKGH